MKCQVCMGAAFVYVEPGQDKIPGMQPCPACLGGEQHCCDGECAQPDLIKTGTPATGSFDG